jgi:serine/threonine protein phosphatase PrpC
MPLWKRRQEQAAPQSEASRRGISYGLARDVGQVRDSNQDQAFAVLTSLPHSGDQLSLGFFIVADGMGGHAGGAIASARAVEVVAGFVLKGLLLPVLRGDPPDAIQNVLRGALLEANARIRQEGVLKGTDMGTTVTAALLLREWVHLAHVGDSRVYTYDQEGLQCRTRDHSLVARLLELGRITPEEARSHPRRNYLYQSVGQQDEIEVEIVSFSLGGCSHLMLCSDGLWGVVEEEVLVQALDSGDDPQAICEHLVDQANEAGGEDNITVVVVALPTDPSA